MQTTETKHLRRGKWQNQRTGKRINSTNKKMVWVLRDNGRRPTKYVKEKGPYLRKGKKGSKGQERVEEDGTPKRQYIVTDTQILPLHLMRKQNVKRLYSYII